MTVPTPDGEPADVATHTILHLSDTHLTAPGIAYNGVLDADASLAVAVDVVRRALAGGLPVDAVVLSGDLTDTGDPSAYRRLARAMETAVAPVSAGAPGGGPPVLFATGNHDVRTVFHAELLGRPDAPEPILQVVDLRGLRVVLLDSTVVGSGIGRLTREHLAELREELSRPAEHGTVVVLHHAPLPPPSPLLTYFALERSSRTALRDALAGTDVRLVLAGHHHVAQSGLLGAVPVAVAGSTTIRVDVLAAVGTDRTVGAGSLNLVRLYPDTHTVTVVPFDEALGAQQVFSLDDAACRRIVADARGD